MSKIFVCSVSAEMREGGMTKVASWPMLVIADNKTDAVGKALAEAAGKYPGGAYRAAVDDATCWIDEHHVNGEVR